MWHDLALSYILKDALAYSRYPILDDDDDEDEYSNDVDDDYGLYRERISALVAQPIAIEAFTRHAGFIRALCVGQPNILPLVCERSGLHRSHRPAM
jgi:hypothetical protein